MGRSQGGHDEHLGKRGRSKWKHGEEKVDSIWKEGGFQGGEAGQVKKTSQGVGENMSERMQKLSRRMWSLTKPEIEKGVGKRRDRSEEDGVKSVRVTLRGGRDTSESRSGIEKDARQPVMARLTAR